MQIDLGTKTLEIADGLTPDGILAAVKADPAFKEACRHAVANSYYCRFEAWPEMADTTACAVAEAFFEGGTEAAEQFLYGLVEDDFDSSPEVYFDSNFDSMQDAVKLSDVIVDAALTVDEDLDLDDYRKEIREAMTDFATEAMMEADKSHPFDMIPGHIRVEAFKVFGVNDASTDIDEVLVTNVSPVFGLGTADPAEGLKALFEGCNVSFDAFAAALSEEHGFDIRKGSSDPLLVEYLAAADYWGDRDAAKTRAVTRADKWATFSPAYDGDSPSLISIDTMSTILDNAGGASLPVYVCRMSLKDLLSHDWTQPAIFWPEQSWGRNKTGGFVGLFDTLNGAGHIESVSAPVPIPAGTEGWKVSGRYGYAIDNVFGIVAPYYYAKPAVDPRPELEPEETPAPAM